MKSWTESIEETIEVGKKLMNIDNKITQAVNLISNCFNQDCKVLLCGNGGSAAEAQHIAAEYVSSLKHDFKRKSLPALALTTDTSFITASSNDYGYDHIFERQLESFGQKGDVLIAISTSGNSKNVVLAVEYAKNHGLSVIGLTGASGGKMDNLCDVIFKVPSKNTMRIQEWHLFIEHSIVEGVEQILFNF